MKSQPWIGKPVVDIVFILLPPFASLLFILLFPSLFRDTKDMSVGGWVALVLLVDVAHVYSTLYRTYLDPKALQQQRSLLWAIPFISFVAGVLVYSMSDQLFWRILAYTAVFHFVRQQYGFMRIYNRKEHASSLAITFDKITIYYATLYPLLYWHLSGPRNFNWFVEKDFVFVSAAFLLPVATALYVLVIGAYLLKEAVAFQRTRSVNVPKVAIITGTLLSWYFGIVYFNGDMAFTLLNVISHGVPYMALVWIYGRKNYTQPGKGSRFLKAVFSNYGVLIFIFLLFVFAFVEEGLWDMILWKEHPSVFGTNRLFQVTLSDPILSIVVPLLAVPQVTHYILDGFIWKIRHDEIKWSSEVRATA